MSEKKRTSVAWFKIEPYNSLTFNTPDGWDRKNLRVSFNEEEIDEDEFRKRLAASNVLLGEKRAADFEKAKKD